MKRYEQILEMIKTLEAEDKRLELAIDDAYANLMANWDNGNRNRCQSYYDKLFEQQEEVNIRIREHKRSLAYFDTNDEIICMIDSDDLYIPNTKFISNKELPRFTMWLMMLNEELGEE